MIRTAAVFGLVITAVLMSSPVHADACNTTGLWIDAVVCDSEILEKLDSDVSGRIDGLVTRLTPSTPELADALAADQAAWRAGRSDCKEDALPQQCMEWRYYARVETITHLTTMFAGPRRFGDPLQVCWKNAEGEKDVQKCLDRRLAEVRTGLGIIAMAVRAVLEKRDKVAGSAGDAAATFDAAQGLFPAYTEAACLSEAAALGQGLGRTLGQAACNIRAWRLRAVDVLRFLPDLPVHWSSNVQVAQDSFARCLDHARGAKLRGPLRVSGYTAQPDNRLRVHLRGERGARHDCTLTASGKSVETFEPAGVEDAGAANDPVFYSTTNDGPVARECFDHDRVFDRAGNHSGWMSYRVC